MTVAGRLTRRKFTPEGLYGRRKMTALRRTGMPDASWGAVDRAMRAWGSSGWAVTRPCARRSPRVMANALATSSVGSSPLHDRITPG